MDWSALMLLHKVGSASLEASGQLQEVGRFLAGDDCHYSVVIICALFPTLQSWNRILDLSSLQNSKET